MNDLLPKLSLEKIVGRSRAHTKGSWEPQETVSERMRLSIAYAAQKSKNMETSEFPKQTATVNLERKNSVSYKKGKSGVGGVSQFSTKNFSRKEASCD